MRTTRHFMGFVAVYALGVMMTACQGGVVHECSTTGGDGGGGEGGAGVGGAPVCQFETECDPAAPFDGKLECNDGDPGTADRCIATGSCGGVCAHVKVLCDAADSAAIQAVVCDDRDPCTNDRCGISACVHTPIGSPECTCITNACANLGADCGTVEADCDGDGVPEDIDCGSCAEPAVCVNNACSDQCASKYAAECEAEGKASTWTFDIECGDGEIYKLVDGEPLFCTGCPAIAGCQKLDNPLPNGVQVMCCP